MGPGVIFLPAVGLLTLVLTGGHGVAQTGVGAVGLAGVFFGAPSPVAFNPEPAAIFSGRTLTFGPTVSADQKYVNLNVSGGETRTTQVQNFAVYAQGGFVGVEGPQGAGGVITNKFVPDPGFSGPTRNSPLIVSQTPPLPGLLGKSGMTRVSGLD